MMHEGTSAANLASEVHKCVISDSLPCDAVPVESIVDVLFCFI